MLLASLLPINQELHTFGAWDEATIELRTKTLLSKALEIWPRPGAS